MQKSQCNFNHFLRICESYKLFSYEHVDISKLNDACAIHSVARPVLYGYFTCE